MSCPNCGSRVPLRAQQCPNCGDPIERPYAAQDLAARWQAWSNPDPEEPARGRGTGAQPRTPGPMPGATGASRSGGQTSRPPAREPGWRAGASRTPPAQPARRPPAPPRGRSQPGRGWSRPGTGPRPRPVTGRPNARRGEPAPEELPPPRPPRGWGEPRAVAMVGTLAAVVAFLAVVLGIESALSAPAAQLATPRSGPATVTPTGTATGGGGASPSAARPSVELARQADPKASDTAYARYDDCNKRFEYNASNMLDGIPSSAWRVSGDGTGAELSFNFDGPHVFTAVGLINGHAKKDACSGADRYSQERRITQVTWTFDGKHPLRQKLADKRPTMQRVAVDSVVATTVTVRIDATTLPAEGRLDYTPISEVSLLGR